MALTNEKGYVSMMADNIMQGANEPVFLTSAIFDDTAEKVAFCGFVWHPTIQSGTINIRKVHFRLGAVTLSVLSTMRVSLQDVSATAGPPYQPDGTQDQTFDYVGATNPPTANAWNTTGNLSADRAVDLSVYGAGTANSRLLAVVLEYATFTALDSIVVSAVQADVSGWTNIGGATALFTASWAVIASSSPVVMLELDDGTFAFMEGGNPVSAIGTATTANNAALRAIGVKFRVPTERKLMRLALEARIPNVCDGSLNLYQDGNNTALAAVPIDNDAVAAASTQRRIVADIVPVTLAANTYYRLVFVPSTTTAATLGHVDVAAAAYMDGLVLGQDAHYTTASDTPPTAWTDTLTRRPIFGLGFSAFHAASSGVPMSRVFTGM